METVESVKLLVMPRKVRFFDDAPLLTVELSLCYNIYKDVMDRWLTSFSSLEKHIWFSHLYYFRLLVTIKKAFDNFYWIWYYIIVSPPEGFGRDG